ncbi:ribokinase [Camelliibacillus cellulosilyticus]|uniref:Deoxyribokinase n=1 Tax=Camelliibacillus cellulosilyticus TaxID=2174486 RepID=A0ABV9GNI2_9BACL
MKILILGSFMMDLVVRTPRAPEKGETIIGTNFHKFPGGKGANQAVAAARLGAEVVMAGKVGNDPFGNEAMETLIKEKVDTHYILRDDAYPTGVGSIVLDENGDNRIVVVPGANLKYTLSDLELIEGVIRDSDILVAQLEMDIDVISAAVDFAHSSHVPVILNPAPAQKLSSDLLEKVTYLTPNETECEILTGIKIFTNDDAEVAAKALLNRGVENVIITLAENGAMIANAGGIQYLPGYSVKAVDTVAAGDAFNGALAVGIAKGKPLHEVVRFANAVGALAVTKEGAIPSLPYLKDVEKFMSQSSPKIQI